MAQLRKGTNTPGTLACLRSVAGDGLTTYSGGRKAGLDLPLTHVRSPRDNASYRARAVPNSEEVHIQYGRQSYPPYGR